MKWQISVEWHILYLVCRLHHTATNKAVPTTSWVATQRRHRDPLDILQHYGTICLLSQSFILCFKMSTVIFSLSFSTTSVVQMDYLDKSNPGHHGSAEAEPQLFPVGSEARHCLAAGLILSLPKGCGTPGKHSLWMRVIQQYISLLMGSVCLHAKKIEGEFTGCLTEVLMVSVPEIAPDNGRRLPMEGSPCYCLVNRKPCEQKTTLRRNSPAVSGLQALHDKGWEWWEGLSNCTEWFKLFALQELQPLRHTLPYTRAVTLLSVLFFLLAYIQVLFVISVHALKHSTETSLTTFQDLNHQQWDSSLSQNVLAVTHSSHNVCGDFFGIIGLTGKWNTLKAEE